VRNENGPEDPSIKAIPPNNSISFSSIGSSAVTYTTFTYFVEVKVETETDLDYGKIIFEVVCNSSTIVLQVTRSTPQTWYYDVKITMKGQGGVYLELDIEISQNPSYDPLDRSEDGLLEELRLLSNVYSEPLPCVPQPPCTPSHWDELLFSLQSKLPTITKNRVMITRSTKKRWGNLRKSSKDPRVQGKSWKGLYEDVTSVSFGSCAFIGCKSKAEVGGHVQCKSIADNETKAIIFIAPICRTCNADGPGKNNWDAKAYKRLKPGTRLVRLIFDRAAVQSTPPTPILSKL
jgi:hypothetical protein